MGGVSTQPGEIEAIRKFANAGLSYAEIGKKLGRSGSYVGYKVKELAEAGQLETAGQTELTIEPVPRVVRAKQAAAARPDLTDEEKAAAKEVIDNTGFTFGTKLFFLRRIW